MPFVGATTGPASTHLARANARWGSGVTYAASFTDPTSIAGLLGWWDPTKSSNAGTSGDPIADQSAAGNPQAGGAGIAHVASGINAKGSFSFDGSTQACNTGHFFATGQPISLCAVVKLTSAVAQYIIGNETANGIGLYVSAGPVWAATGASAITGGTPNTSAHFVIAIINGASSSLVVDGTTVATGNCGSSTMGGGPLGMGFGPTPSSFVHFGGQMGDVFWYSVALGPGNITNLHTWASTKWGTP